MIGDQTEALEPPSGAFRMLPVFTDDLLDGDQPGDRIATVRANATASRSKRTRTSTPLSRTGPSPGHPVVISVRIAPERPYGRGGRTVWTQRTMWMLPRLLPRPPGANGLLNRPAPLRSDLRVVPAVGGTNRVAQPRTDAVPMASNSLSEIGFYAPSDKAPSPHAGRSCAQLARLVTPAQRSSAMPARSRGASSCACSHALR